MSDHLFVQTKAAGLDEVARDFFRLMMISNVAEGDSSNYVGGSYMEGRAAGLRLRVAITDHDRFSKSFPFWISIERYGPPIVDNDYIHGCGDTVARLLAEAGWAVARPATESDFTDAKEEVHCLVYKLVHGSEHHIIVTDEVK